MLVLIYICLIFQFDKDAVNGIFNIGTESWAVLVWSFSIVPGATFRGRPDHCNAIDLPGMPVNNFDFINPKCSCLGGSSILVESENTCTQNHNSDSDKDDLHNSDADNNDNELFTSIVQIRGSTYDDIYQQNLKVVQSALRQNQDIEVNLLSEADNPKDKNAISVNVVINGKELKLGYVGLKKIPKVTAALKAGEIVQTTVKSVTSWYIRNLNCRKLKGSIIMCKKGNWLPDSDNNKYNSDL